MKTYLFKTFTTMKEYNKTKWSIDSDIIEEKYINANTPREALKKYREEVENKHYVLISDNALKHKSPMYVDSPSGDAQQVGYVITGKTYFEDDFHNWSKQYIELWVQILEIINPKF